MQRSAMDCIRMSPFILCSNNELSVEGWSNRPDWVIFSLLGAGHGQLASACSLGSPEENLI